MLGSRHEGICRAGVDEKQSLPGSRRLRRIADGDRDVYGAHISVSVSLFHGASWMKGTAVPAHPERARIYHSDVPPTIRTPTGAGAPGLCGAQIDPGPNRERPAGCAGHVSSPAAGRERATGIDGAREALLQSCRLAHRPNRSAAGPSGRGRSGAIRGGGVTRPC